MSKSECKSCQAAEFPLPDQLKDPMKVLERGQELLECWETHDNEPGCPYCVIFEQDLRIAELTVGRTLPDHLKDPMKVLERGQELLREWEL